MQDQPFDVPDLRAILTIEILGLAVCCFNSDYYDSATGRRGRWEVAIPRAKNHDLTLIISPCGHNRIPQASRVIEIKNHDVVKVINPIHRLPGRFKRDDSEAFPRDFRWVTGFTDEDDLPHGKVTPNRNVDTTMFYIYDATFYAPEKQVNDGPVVRATHGDTGRVSGDDVVPVPEHQAGPILDRSFELGFIASRILVDVHMPASGLVDIIFDTSTRTTIGRKGTPTNVVIQNIENSNPNTPEPEGSRVRTPNYRYGRGDLFRYYRLFDVTAEKFHFWERTGVGQSVNSGGARTGDCNGIRVDLPNLDALKRP